MFAYVTLIVCHVIDSQRAPGCIIDGIAKGLLVPVPILSVEYFAVYRRDIKNTLLVTIAWFVFALAVGGDLYVGLFSSGWLLTDAPVLLRLFALVAIILVPVYIGLSHLLWWTTLRRDSTRKQIPQ